MAPISEDPAEAAGEPGSTLADWIDRFRAGAAPSGADVLVYAREHYDRHAGLTERLLAERLTPDGRTSYEVLLEALPDCRGRTIVDLACGNGPLIEPCLRRVGPAGRVIGVDVSAEQLALARRRTPAPNAVFLCEPAQALSLETASVDAVLCHLAFMAMRPIEAVTDEIARVLRPGGLFSAVLGGIACEAPLYDEFGALVLSAVRAEAPRFDGFGDRRTLTMEGLRGLFSRERGFRGGVEKHDFDLVFEGEPARLAGDLALFFNAFHLLSEPGRERVRRAGRERLERERDARGRVLVRVPETRIDVRRA